MCRLKVEQLPEHRKTLMENVRKTWKRLKKQVRKGSPLFVSENANAIRRSNEPSLIMANGPVVRAIEGFIGDEIACRTLI